ncbi:hypothetical protein B0H14DRAFT_527429 [Mycena olivaceomarginata]|nr:hypothetical protein B0H14DRAFT_527429 [Mycena olivaceomarginata]
MPGAPLVTELRDRIVVWRERTVYNILRNEREYGQTTNPHAQHRGRPRTLNMGDIDYLSALLDATPTLYLHELQAKLWDARAVDVSIPTLSRAIRRLAITNKKAVHGDIPMEYCVWLDEASVDNRTHQRTRGWAGMGRVCVRRETFIRVLVATGRGLSFGALGFGSQGRFIICSIGSFPNSEETSTGE